MNLPKPNKRQTDNSLNSKILFVDKSRADVYTETGNEITPFKTISSAINAVIALNTSDPVCIKINSGIYAENIVLEDLKLKKLSFEGIGYVAINPAENNSVQSNSNNDNLLFLSFNNITFFKPIVITGQNGTAAFEEPIFLNCNFMIAATITLKALNAIYLDNCYSERDMTFENVAVGYIKNCILDNDIVIFKADSTTTYSAGGYTSSWIHNNLFCSACPFYIASGDGEILTTYNASKIGDGSDVTLYANVNIVAYNSYFDGDYILETGSNLELDNSYIEGTITNNGGSLLENTFAKRKIEFNALTSSRDLAESDIDKMLRSNSDSSSAITLTIQKISETFDVPEGSQFMIYQRGTGTITIAAGTDVTIRNVGALHAQYKQGAIFLDDKATNTWVASLE